MATNTPNYALTKPLPTEYYDVAVQNSNMDKIDTALKSNADATTGKIDKSLATTANDFLVATGVGAWVKKTLAETKAILGITLSDMLTLLGDSFFKQSNYGNILTKSASATLALTDANKVITMTSGSSQTITIPANATAAFPVGTQIVFTMQGAGAVVFAPSGGVTLQSKDTKRTIDGQYASATLIKTATDTWALIGALKA